MIPCQIPSYPLDPVRELKLSEPKRQAKAKRKEKTRERPGHYQEKTLKRKRLDRLQSHRKHLRNNKCLCIRQSVNPRLGRYCLRHIPRICQYLQESAMS